MRVDPPMTPNDATEAQPLRSTRITRSHRYYELLRPCALHRYAGSYGVIHLSVSLHISTTGSHVPRRSPEPRHATSTPDTTQPVDRLPLDLSRTTEQDPVLMSSTAVAFDASAVVRLRSSHDSPHDASFDAFSLRWTPSFGPKSGLAKVEPAGSVLVVVVSCELGCRPGPGTRNGPTPVRGDGVQVAAGAPRSGVGAERRTWRRSSTPAPGAEAARALMRRGTSTSSHRTRPASDSPTTYAVARHCRSGSSARFPRAPRSANHRGAGRSPHT